MDARKDVSLEVLLCVRSYLLLRCAAIALSISQGILSNSAVSDRTDRSKIERRVHSTDEGHGRCLARVGRILRYQCFCRFERARNFSGDRF